MTLIFKTPSKRCPFRSLNGRQVEIVEFVGRQKLRRLGWKRAPVYRVRTSPYSNVGGYQWTAYGDELFVVKPPLPRGSLVGTMDEYGTIWDGEPGVSNIIGDLVSNDSDETCKVYLTPGATRRVYLTRGAA